MWVNFDRRLRVQDTDPTLNFKVGVGETEGYSITLRGKSTPIVEITVISKEQLVALRTEIDAVFQRKAEKDFDEAIGE